MVQNNQTWWNYLKSIMSQTVWIARHGNRLDFVRPEWFDTADRPYDPPLSKDGFVQAKQLAQRLKGENIRHIFASPFLRTVQTAHAVAEALDLPLKLEWGICEWLNPEWMSTKPETAPLAELVKKYPRIDLSYQSYLLPQYPEAPESVCLNRAAKTASYLAATFSEDILLVGHGATVLGSTMGFIPGVTDFDIRTPLCCLVKLVRENDQWAIALNGDTSHLTEIESVIRLN